MINVQTFNSTLVVEMQNIYHYMEHIVVQDSQGTKKEIYNFGPKTLNFLFIQYSYQRNLFFRQLISKVILPLPSVFTCFCSLFSELQIHVRYEVYIHVYIQYLHLTLTVALLVLE